MRPIACFRAILSLLLAGVCAPVRAGATYYFAANGSDASDCLSPSSPCRSLERLNALPQLPGASFLLRRGDRFPGEILAQGSGSPGSPVTFSAYGDGPAPVIDGGLSVTAWSLASQGPAAWIYSADAPPEADGQPFALLLDDRALPLARFPDTGFAKVASADSESLVLEPHAYAGHLRDASGAVLRARAQRGVLSSRTVRGFDTATGRLTWDGPLPKPLAPGAGILLEDAAMELDHPGEWYFHPSGSPPPRDGHRLRLALAPGDAPAAHSIRIANAGYGIKGSGLAHVRIAGLAFEDQVSAAVYLYGCAHAEVSDCRIRNAILTGIDFRGSGLIATGNSIEGAALAGIAAGPDPALGPLGTAETGARILGNRIARIGLFPALPRPGPDGDAEMGIGIRARGDGDRIGGNRIDSTSCDGIRFLGRRVAVEGNVLRKTCLHLDDAGAIHVGPVQGAWGSEGSEVRRNAILDAPGSAAGTAGAATQAYGIFLDEKTADIRVTGNFIAEADLGICVRGGRGHAIEGNVLYANRQGPWRDRAGQPRPGEAANRSQDNLSWSIWSKGTGFLPEQAASLGNAACAESEGSAVCEGPVEARYPGTPPSALATRLREAAKRLGSEETGPEAAQAILKSILPAARTSGN